MTIERWSFFFCGKKSKKFSLLIDRTPREVGVRENRNFFLRLNFFMLVFIYII
jgi:hypothetical protein